MTLKKANKLKERIREGLTTQPLRGTNSTTTNHITNNKDNFRTLSSQGLFESIVINLTETTLAAVILGFSTVTNPEI